jgi:hypothetical protein
MFCVFVNFVPILPRKCSRDARDIEMTNLQAHVQLQSNTTANQNFQSPAISKKVSRMGGIATPLAGISTIQSPLRYGLKNKQANKTHD